MSDPTDDEVFRAALAASPIGDRALARKVEVSLATVKRWRSGKNLPHPAVRKFVIEALQEEPDETIEEA